MKLGRYELWPSPYAPEAVPARGLRSARVVALITAVSAAAGLAWSLNITPGEALFYPATLLVAMAYAIGSTLVARLTRTPTLWPSDRRAARDAALAGAALAVLFCVGALLVRYVPVLREPVARLLEHAQTGYLALVAVTTAANGVAEELFYRGALWTVLPPRTRILVTTAAYTLVTAMVGIPLLAVAAAMLGVTVAVLRERDRSLVGPVIAHLIWSLTMLFALPHIVM